MPPKQWIDKKNASKFQLFHRSQNDPLIHDTSADDRFLYQVGGPAPAPAPASSSVKSSKKPLPNLSDLQSEYGDSARKNEGEAANYGVYYDDSNYDYMQHLRELGSGTGDAYFVEAKTEKAKGRAGRGMKLEDALRQVSLVDKDTYGQSASVGPSLHGSQYGDMRSTASSYVRKPTYQDQQNVPDAIAGFKPDMDPRLREALEALEDEAFVEDGDDDGIFDQLTANAEEIDEGDWEDSLFDDVEDEGWESDATEKAPVQPDSTKADRSFDDDLPEEPVKPPMDPSEMPEHDKPAPDMEPTDQSWMSEFAKFKKDAKAGNAPAPAAPTIAASQTMASTVFTAGGTPIRRKKRKGALTNPSAYSMTSSALARTAGHRLLDDRFDKVEQLYSLDEEDEYDDSMSMISGMTGATGMTGMSTASSQAPSLIDGNGDAVHSRSTFNNVMDDFLSSWDPNTSGQAKRHGAKHKRGKNGNEAIGIKMLDEVRSGLGPARIRGPKGKVSGTA
ncbi:Low temperature viability protein [Penicillium cf. griseofulvum]|uniref:Low temperature viability protein n=1 Tax=Penicillium cf. griseofulvum TaxID=2972120 RepID=A0A9W9JQ01_9EURO|nr:Low temperature viability protein [Penicillium cf. griseofulvum]KAJ5442774.1 Low temperature viability protein [Penicillium cf. griseofulvum]KAJ5451428.1 Low temperature viability protein [Penicillium cf. griseofulvum]